MAAEGDDSRSNTEDAVEERVAALWKDDRAAENAVLSETATDDDASEMTFDIDALTDEDSDLGVRDDEASDAGESSRLDSGIPDQESTSGPRVSPDGRESPG